MAIDRRVPTKSLLELESQKSRTPSEKGGRLGDRVATSVDETLAQIEQLSGTPMDPLRFVNLGIFGVLLSRSGSDMKQGMVGVDEPVVSNCSTRGFSIRKVPIRLETASAALSVFPFFFKVCSSPCCSFLLAPILCLYFCSSPWTCFLVPFLVF